MSDWTEGLSTRIKSCVHGGNINSREELLAAYLSGEWKPGVHPRCYGWKSHVELAKWLGRPEPRKPARKIFPPKLCPHCGGVLNKSKDLSGL